MEGGGGSSGGKREKSSSLSKSSKFSVYQNPALSAALTANSLRPAKFTFLCIFFVSIASAFSLLGVFYRDDGRINNLVLGHVSRTTAYLLTKAMQIVVGLVFLGTLSALIRALSLQRARNVANVSKGAKEQRNLTERQRALLGMRPKPGAYTESPKKPPKSKPQPSTSPYDALVPLHQSISNSNRSSLAGAEKSNTSSGSKMGAYYTSPKSPVASPSSLYLVPSTPLQGPSVQPSPALDRQVSTPWSKQRTPAAREITSEKMLEQFLADVDEKITESATKLATPPATINSFGIASPSNVANSATNSGTTRSTPLRPVRMSPGSQKFSTPPKKGEGDLPVPMSMEESIEAFQNLGTYPHIEQWRDRLRQWFSSILLNPLLNKIETSHTQVMQSAIRLGITITVSQVGSGSPSTGVSTTVSPIDGSKEWQQAFTLDEDGMLHQLRATLVQAIDASMSKFPFGNLQQPPQQNFSIPVMQECVDAITEHQRLHALMKGEWVKGLLPQTSVRSDYTVQRIRELAEGTCLKNYEYLGSGEVYDKVNKKWTLELPTDSHLLLYLFCAFLEHPKWMLHVDPTSYSTTQSSKNPLFLGLLPPKERFPEKYLAVISNVPSVLHPGACILVVGKQSPPIFALYWEKKLQFSLQGRTALWDAVLLLCHRIKVAYGGVIRGMHLGSSTFSILPVLDLENEE
ncbi:hypothetical protein NE237_010644 [Protea cynaroides]|uniref:Cytochrome B561-related protein n=1 Tax=Protea cynaroides TaxID=273540 RepID=A0A9Q0L042_9MAGN|nr:hypothetical protein NE237_010644 [Protea cynaroides]